MKVLVTGVNGQLGYDVVRQLESRKIECKGVDLDDFNLTDSSAVHQYITKYAPTVVVHCAAYTAVDRAEDDRETSYAVNVRGSGAVAIACQDVGAKMVYISTDYVFDGEGDEPFSIHSMRKPKNQYGLTKMLGEDEVTARLDKYFIIRIAWAFGINGSNFVKKMIKLGSERTDLNVVDDQYGSPTYTADLAILICDMIATDRYGIYHATNEGYCSWFEFACAIMKTAGLPVCVHPVSSSQFTSKAIRPTNSRLSKDSLDAAGFQRLPTWQDALSRFVRLLNQPEQP